MYYSLECWGWVMKIDSTVPFLWERPKVCQLKGGIGFVYYFLTRSALNSGSVLLQTPWPKQLGEEMVYLAHHSSSPRNVRTGAPAGQESGWKSCCRGYGDALVIGLLALHDLLSLLAYRTQGHQPRGGLTHNGPGLPKPVTKKMPYDFPTTRFYGCIF